jgi:hypothetical protein
MFILLFFLAKADRFLYHGVTKEVKIYYEPFSGNKANRYIRYKVQDNLVHKSLAKEIFLV